MKLKHKNLYKVVKALEECMPPLTTRDFYVSLTQLPERSVRRHLELLKNKAVITLKKQGRGYTKGVTHVIEEIDKEKLEEFKREYDMATLKET